MVFQTSMLLAAALTSVSAQYINNNTLWSCADVECPPATDSTAFYECRVTNRTYGSIGLESFSTSISENQDNLTWTIGMHVHDNLDPDNNTFRQTEKNFYLGTPPSLNLTSDDLPYQGCAIFLYANTLVRPAGWNESQQCPDVIGTDCVTSLMKDATAFLVGGQNDTETAEDACQRVQSGLNETFASGCRKVTDQDSWHGIQAIPLTGNNAPKPPTQAANESSTCHPTLPKSNDLSFAFGYNDTGTSWSNSTYHMFYGVNLVLTMFWSPDSSAEDALRVPDSHLSCLWAETDTATMSDGASPSTAFRSAGLSTFLGVVAFALALFQIIIM